MKALVLAGGKGTRLHPYTVVLPKPLMPVGDYPILEIILRQLKHAGVDSVTLAVGHMSQLFQAFFGSGERLGLPIDYTFEERPLGTAGAIGGAIDRLGDDFFILNGDLLTTLDFASMFAAHRASGAAATTGLYTRRVHIDFGVVEMDEDLRLEGYREKPTLTVEVSMGVSVLKTEVVREFITPGEPLDMPDLLMRMVEAGHLVRGYRGDCYWLDIGRIDDYHQASEVFEERKEEFFRE